MAKDTDTDEAETDLDAPMYICPAVNGVEEMSLTALS